MCAEARTGSHSVGEELMYRQAGDLQGPQTALVAQYGSGRKFSGKLEAKVVLGYT